MKSHYIRWYLPFVFFTIVFSISNVSVTASATERQSPPQTSLTEEDIRKIVREELLSIQKRTERKDLDSLLQEYSLADDSAQSMKYGSNSARFTLQMFSDIECPFCRQMYFEVKKVVDYSEGVINWEYKHFPLAGHNPVAAVAAQAIECIAAEQGKAKAWVALDQFIKLTQGNGKGVQQELPDFVRSFGLNGSMLKNCLLSDDSKIQVNEDFKLGTDLGITGTPAILLKDNLQGKDYLIKGKKSPEQLLQAIQSVM